MHADEGDQRAWNNKHMDGKEAGQGFTGDDWSAQHCVNQRSSDERDSTHDGSPDTKAPVRILVETQDLPCERHPERHQQKEDPDNPGQLAWIFISAKQEYLHHVNQHERDHEIGAPTVKGADEPTEGLLMV